MLRIFRRPRNEHRQDPTDASRRGGGGGPGSRRGRGGGGGAGGERQVLAEGATVREVLDDLAERYPALGARILDNGGVAPFVNVYVEGEDVRTREGLDTPVGDASTVILLPAMAGG